MTMPRVRVKSDGAQHEVAIIKADGTEELIPWVTAVEVDPLELNKLTTIKLTIKYPLLDVVGELETTK